jgi:hypothetical protein
MEHSENFDKVQDYYQRGMWSAKRVKAAIGKWITAEEAKEILDE